MNVVGSAQVSLRGVTHAMRKGAVRLVPLCGAKSRQARYYSERFYETDGEIGPITCRRCLQKLLNAPPSGTIS